MNFKQALPAELYDQVVATHPYRFDVPSKIPARHVRVDADWNLHLDGTCGELARQAAEDTAAFFHSTFGIRIGQSRKGDGKSIRVSVEPAGEPRQERYRRAAHPDGISVVADDDEGAMRALFHLQRDMLLSRAPIVKVGALQRQPNWRWRVGYTLIHQPIDRPADYLDYPDAYLMNMARHGYNATYVYLDLFDHISPEVEPLLAPRDYRKRIEDLNRVVARLKGFGIRTLFHMNTLVLPAEHPLFTKHPEMRGARSWGGELYCLCSSSRRVLDLYERTGRQLFTDAPDLAGAVMLVGGECFLHCYSRPNPRTEAGTHCPACRKRPVAEVVSGVVNAVTRGACAREGEAPAEPNVSGAGTRAARQEPRPPGRPIPQIFCWQYSGFVWGDTSKQQNVIDKLDPRCASLETFEKDDWLTIDGTKSYVFDYSISQLGPSPRFRKLAGTARRRNIPMVARTEASQNIEMFVVPRLPIMHRWAERSRRLRAAGVDGVHTSWRFYGFCSQMTDEIIDHFAWNDGKRGNDASNDEILARIAARDFGPGAAATVVRAWRELSEAFGHFPYSGGITGFPYFRGPMFIGPAHPLIFDQTAPTGLPDAFYTPDPSLGEGFKDVQSQAIRRPNFFLDLTWTQPFGARKIRKPLERLDRGWSKGVRLLDAALKRAAGDDVRRLTFERDLAAMIGCCFRTTLNLLDVQELRNNVTEHPTTLPILRQTCRRAIEVVRAERENAERGLELAKRHPSFGFGSAYGRAFGPELIQAKIDHCDRLISHGIPYFYEIHAFHIFGDTRPL